MGFGGDGRGRRKRPLHDDREAPRRDGPPRNPFLDGGKGDFSGRGDRGAPLRGGPRSLGYRPEVALRQDRGRAAPRARQGREEERRDLGKGQRRPQERRPAGKGRGRKKGEGGEKVEEAPQEEDDLELASQPWKLLEKELPPKEEPKEEDKEEEQAEEFEEVEEEVLPDEPEPAPPPEKERKLLPPPPPPPPPAAPQPRPTEAPSAGPRKRRREEDEEEVLTFAVELVGVPKEYTHSSLVVLHESLGLDASTLETSSFMKPGATDEEHTCKVILKYATKAGAEEAVSKLGGYTVTAVDGASRTVVASLQSSTSSSSASPQVYISEVPAEFTEQALEDLHIAAGLPEDALVSSTFLPSKDPSADSKCCIASYKDSQLAEKAVEALSGMPVWSSDGGYRDLKARMVKAARSADPQAAAKSKGTPNSKRPRQEVDGSVAQAPAPRPEAKEPGSTLPTGEKLTGTVKVWFEERGFGFVIPDSGGPDVYVHRSALADGSYLSQKSKVTFTVQWDTAKGKYLAVECSGAQGEQQEPPVQPSDELQAFADRWSLDRAVVEKLARMPEEVQVKVIEQFQPEEAEGEEAAGGNNLFVAGLPPDASEGLLRGIFGAHGTVVSCRILSNRSASRCAALVRMADGEQAQTAIASLSQATPDGCMEPIIVRHATSNVEKNKGKGKGGKARGKGQVTNHNKAVFDLARSIEAVVSSPGKTRDLPLGVTLLGTLKFWNDRGNYGFIVAEIGGPDVYVHKRVVKEGVRLRRDTKVSFRVEWDAEGGKYRATEVVCPGGASPGPPPERPPPPPPVGPSSRVDGRSGGPVPPPEPRAQPQPVARPSRAPVAGARHRGIVKVWVEERGFGFIVPESGAPDIYVHRSMLQDGSYLLLDSLVRYNVQWDPAKARYNAEECWGAIGERQEPLVRPSRELESFAERWSLDRDSVMLIAKMPQEVQLQIFAEYRPEEPEEEEQDDCGAKLWVSGLPIDATEDLVQRIFSEHGVVEDCKVLANRSDRMPDRAALVRMADAGAVEDVIASLDQAVPDGCDAPITVRHASKNSSKGKGKGKGKGKTAGVNHSKAVVMLARSLEAQMDEAPMMDTAQLDEAPMMDTSSGGGGGGAVPVQPTRQVPAVPSSSSSSSAEVKELECGVMLSGTVKLWNDSKAYGFVTPDGGGPDVFVHRLKLKDGSRLERGARVTFVAQWDNDGWRYRASEVLGAAGEPELPPELPQPAAEQRGAPGRPGKGGARGQGGPPPLPPPPPPSAAAGGRVPLPLPPRHRQAQQALPDESDLNSGPRPPDTPPPQFLSEAAPAPPPVLGQVPKVLTPKPKVRAASSPSYTVDAGEAEAYPSSDAPYEVDSGEAPITVEDDWVVADDNVEVIGYDEQWSEEQPWGEGEQWPAEVPAEQQADAGGDTSW